MKKYLLIVLVSAITIMAGLPAFAINTNSDAWIWVVDGYGETEEQATIDLDETPWLYIKLPSTAEATVGAWWYNPDFFPYEGVEVTGVQTTETDRWVSLSNWAEIKAVGTWTIYGMHWYEAGTYTPAFDSQSTTFTFAPEPIGCTLFALGGLCLAALRRRRGLK